MMKDALDWLRAHAHPMLEAGLHKGHNVAHMAYLGLVSVESHGWYGKAALALLVIGVASHFAGVGVSDD